MVIDLKKEEHKNLMETMLMKRVKDCIEVISLRQLTGGSSRQMFTAELKTNEGNLSFVLRLVTTGFDHNFYQLTLPQEAIVINAVSKAAIKTARIQFELQLEDGLGEGYAMEFLQGEALGGRIAKSSKFSEARAKLTIQVGEMLGKLHCIDIKAAGLDTVLPSPKPVDLINKLFSLYKKSGLYVPIIDYTFRWLNDNMVSDRKAVLTHGDFRLGNFLVDPQEGLLAILDWETSFLSDPMRDLAYLCMRPWSYGVSSPEVGGFGTKEELFVVYEKFSGIKVEEDRFKWWSVYSNFWWTIICIQLGLSYRDSEGKLGDRLSIGRRSSEGKIDIVNLLLQGKVNIKPPIVKDNSDEMATLLELVHSTIKDLMSEVVPTMKGKPLFVTRVGLSNLSIAAREIEMGAARDHAELESANVLLQEEFENVVDCRKRICEDLRKEKWTLDEDALKKHLRDTVVREIEIDNPKYTGLIDALAIEI